MRPKVSRGIKTIESTKNLALIKKKQSKQNDPFNIEELDLGRLSKRQMISGINTCRTQISTNNYTSRTNQTDKRPLQSLQMTENRKTYAQIQKQKNLYRKSQLTRNNSKSRILQNQQNKFQKPLPKQIQQIASIDVQILKILEQENIQCKQLIKSLKRDLEQKDMTCDFLRKTNYQLEQRMHTTQKQFLWIEQTMKSKQKQMIDKNNQIQVHKKEIQSLQNALQVKSSTHSRKVSFVSSSQQIGKLRDQNDLLQRQQQTFKNQLKNIRKQNVQYRRQIAKFKREMMQKEQNWIQMGQRSSIRIAEGIKQQLRQFGQQRIRQYEQMLRSSQKQIEFLRQKNKSLQGKLHMIKQKQIKELISLKRSLQKPSLGFERSQSISYKKTHMKSRSMAMLDQMSFLPTQQDILYSGF